MPQLPVPLSGENVEDLIAKVKIVLTEMFEDGIGSAKIGDVFSFGTDDVLTLNILYGLEKTSGYLNIKLSQTGGLQVGSTTGLSIKLATNSGLQVDINGTSILLDSNPGLELGTGGIKVKLKSGYGIDVDSDGLKLKRQAHEADASTSHTITDPADSPASADALRDDLVANTIPSIESALNSLGTKINNILAKLETAEVLASS
ncbi:MAG: hypothetical protein A4E67_00229 [Syntrophaceae bacterium PtaB.Bin038]|nr:MAG: hypothetical protein A4E67_00229 [Syntrophaceae bacterium PtaB.Bin038]